MNTVDRQLRTVGPDSLTIDGIAAETGCAKGLVTYHFKNKAALVAAAAQRLFDERDSRWREALTSASIEEAIQRSWRLIEADVAGGFWKAQAHIASIHDIMTVQTVSASTSSFAEILTHSVGALLGKMDLLPTITGNELGYLVSAALQGFGLQLANGLSSQEVEGAHTALWLAVLSLTRRGRGGS